MLDDEIEDIEDAQSSVFAEVISSPDLEDKINQLQEELSQAQPNNFKVLTLLMQSPDSIKHHLSRKSPKSLTQLSAIFKDGFLSSNDEDESEIEALTLNDLFSLARHSEMMGQEF